MIKLPYVHDGLDSRLTVAISKQKSNNSGFLKIGTSNNTTNSPKTIIILYTATSFFWSILEAIYGTARFELE